VHDMTHVSELYRVRDRRVKYATRECAVAHLCGVASWTIRRYQSMYVG